MSFNELPEIEWEETENDLQETGCALQATVGEYILLVRTCTPSDFSQFRNRVWTVYWKRRDLENVLARGCCNGTATAQKLAMAVVRNEVRQ